MKVWWAATTLTTTSFSMFDLLAWCQTTNVVTLSVLYLSQISLIHRRARMSAACSATPLWESNYTALWWYRPGLLVTYSRLKDGLSVSWLARIVKSVPSKCECRKTAAQKTPRNSWRAVLRFFSGWLTVCKKYCLCAPSHRSTFLRRQNRLNNHIPHCPLYTVFSLDSAKAVDETSSL